MNLSLENYIKGLNTTSSICTFEKKKIVKSCRFILNIKKRFPGNVSGTLFLSVEARRITWFMNGLYMFTFLATTYIHVMASECRYKNIFIPINIKNISALTSDHQFFCMAWCIIKPTKSKLSNQCQNILIGLSFNKYFVWLKITIFVNVVSYNLFATNDK